MHKPIRVLLVDDSAFIRHIVQKHLQADPDIEVVGAAKDGLKALAIVPTLQPDVIVLDVEMPDMDGLTTLQRIMATHPTPVVMLSALTQKGASTTIRALMRGAVDFVPKPDANASIHMVMPELIQKIKTASQTHQSAVDPATASQAQVDKATPRPFVRDNKLIIIGTSTGGPRALRCLIPNLPGNLAAAILIVQHMPPGYTTSLAQRLHELSAVAVREASDGDPVERGLALLTPGNYHLKVKKRRVFLHQGPPRNHVRPAVDVTMETAVDHFGSHIIGVILTGMGQDGTEGAARIKDAGGVIIAEHQSTAVVDGMPGSIVRAGLADYILPLPEIAPALARLTSNGRI